MARIELSNAGGGGGGGTLTLTTTGTSGASTLVGTALNIPVYQGQLTLSTAGTSGASTLVGNTLTIPTYQGALTLTTTGTGAATLVGTTLNIPTPVATAPGGSNTDIQYNNSGAFGGSSNLQWDNTNVRLNVGAPSSPTGRLNVKGSGSLSGTTNFRITNSGNTEILKVTDDGELTVFKPLTASGRLATFFGYQVPYQLEASIEIGMQSSNDGVAVIGGSNFTANRGGFIQTKNPTTRAISFNELGAVKVCGSQILTNEYTGLSVGASANISGNIPGIAGVVFRTIDATMTSVGGNSSNFNQSSFGQITVNRQVLPTTYTDASNVYIVGPPIQGTATLTNRFSLFVASGNSYFAENVSAGVKLASARLHVRGANTTAGVGAFLVEDGNATPRTLNRIDNDGKITYWATNTAAGTTAPQTINRPSGTVNFAAADVTKVVTNSLCTTFSIVFATVRTADTTAYIKNVVPGAGSFTIELGAAATAETSVGFFIIN